MKKAFLCVNITDNEDNETIDGASLAAVRITAEQETALDKAVEEANDVVLKKAKLPLWLRIIEWVCGLVALLLITGILRSDVDFATAYHNAAPIFYIAGVTLVIAGVIASAGFFRSRKVMNSDEAKTVLDRVENYVKTLSAYLGVPTDAENIDVLMMWYKEKNGERKIKKIIDETHQNHEYKVFVNGTSLCFADPRVKYELPLEGITAIKRIKEKVVVSDWNKEEAYNSKTYKPYKITANKNEVNYFFKNYLILEFTANGEEYEMFFPPYEDKLLTKLTGLSIIEE